MQSYPDFISSTGYGDVAGLCGANCRHSFDPYVEGLSPVTYTDADLDRYAAATVTYKGVTIPYYEATQRQRRMERDVKRWDRIVRTKKAAGLDASAENIKLKAARRRVKDFTEQTGA